MKNKRLASIVLCLILVASTLTGMALPNTATQVNAVSTDMAQTSANQYGLLDQVEGGLILHCWCWSFNTIKANLEKPAPKPKQKRVHKPYVPAPKVTSPGNFQWEKSKDDSSSFEDMMNKFKRTSEDKISDLKRGNESRGYSRRGNRNK